jgi:hypothetical protein
MRVRLTPLLFLFPIKLVTLLVPFLLNLINSDIMLVKSVTKSISMSSSSDYQLKELSKEFDKKIENVCNDLENATILDVVVTVSQDGTSNWQGGVHNVVMNAIIKYETNGA